MPSAAEVETDGVLLGDLNARLLKKIEELTLYQIALLERIKGLESKNVEIEKLKRDIELLKKE